MTDTQDPDQLPSTPEGETDGPDVAMQIFGFVVAIAFVIIAATFVYDSLKDVF